MPETNLFEIYATDEFHSTAVEPSAWLKSLPIAERIDKLEHYLADLQAEYDMVVDATERARISILKTAARHYLDEIKSLAKE